MAIQHSQGHSVLLKVNCMEDFLKQNIHISFSPFKRSFFQVNLG